MKRLRLIDKIICIQISERDLAQRLNFSYKQQDFFIYTDDVIVRNVHDMQNEKLLIWVFFNNFAWMLQLAIVVQLLFITDFLNLKNDQSFILNDDNDKA